MSLLINTSYSKKLSNLVKIYIKGAKYNNRNNSFIFKLKIFHDIYLSVYVSYKTKIKIYFTMLKSLIYDYYYKNISINGIVMNFDKFYFFIKNYFKKAKYK